jgi:predicted Zn finger-like uncharacterized protein
MKVVCDGCQAKYKLTDGRLAGRRLKFRCRKCGNTIVIDGAELSHHTTSDTLELSIPAEGFSQESVAGFESSAPEWYLSIEGEPYGPCTTDQMASMLGDGQVPWDTYVWREGYPEWKAASDSRTLVRGVRELSAHAGGDASFDRGHDGMHDGMHERSYDDDWDASSQPGAPGQEASGHFEQRSASQRGSSSDGYDAEYSAADQAGFDVAPGREEPTKVGYVDPNTGRLAYGGEEASGLIDIRALSALAGSQRNPRFSERRSPSGAYTPDDDRFSLTSPGERLRGHNGLDTLAPVARTRSVAGKAVPLAILGGSALIAVAAFAAIYSTPAPGGSSAAIAAQDEHPIAPPHETTQVAEPAAPSDVISAPEPTAPPPPREPGSATAQAAAAAAIKERKSAMALARSERAKRAAEAAAIAAEADATSGAATSGAATSGAATSGAATSADAAVPAPSSAATPAPSAVGAAPVADGSAPNGSAPSTEAAKSATGNPRSIDELLQGAVAESDEDLENALAIAAQEPGHVEAAEAAEANPGAPAPDAAGLQPIPTREQVLAAMRAVEPDVRSCTEGQSLESYTAAAAFSVTGATGRVGSVRITGIQGAVGSCIARAVRNAIFPPFAKSQLRINFPFRLGP